MGKRQNLHHGATETRRHGEKQKPKPFAADYADKRGSGKAKLLTTKDTKEHKGDRVIRKNKPTTDKHGWDGLKSGDPVRREKLGAYRG